MKIVVCPFVLFRLSIVLSVFLRFTDSDYPFGIFKLLLVDYDRFHFVGHVFVIKYDHLVLSFIYNVYSITSLLIATVSSQGFKGYGV